ncbi:MAG: DUF262 domain-containing HNH endonuclease family protein [Candidatus Micrarchaeota archaeon]
MTDNEISAREIAVGDLFKDNFLFSIPIYQRPFSWDTQNFEKLIEDIFQASEMEKSQYFLGSILLQEIGKKRYELVDGQQRITALTILMAVIRDSTDNESLKESLQKSIYQEKDEFKETPETMRLMPWDELRDKFREYVYAPGGTDRFLKNFDGESKDQNDSDYHIYEAINIFKEELSKISDVKEFVKYLFTKTYIVYISTSNRTSAFRLFNVLNTRGKPLTTSDLLKSENLGEIKDSQEKEKYSKIWKSIEENMGRESLEDVIAFIRTIKRREKAKVSIYEEYQSMYREGMIERGSSYISLLEDMSEIYSEKVLEGRLNSTSPEKNNRYKTMVKLMCHYLPFSDWIPPFIHYYHKFRKEELMFDMLLKLERKTFIEWAAGFSFTQRLTSLNKIIKLIDRSDTPEDVIEHVLTYRDEEDGGRKEVRTIDFTNQNEIENALLSTEDSQLYSKFGGKFAKYILLRIDIEKSELENVSKEYTGTISVEHILPRTPNRQSEWVQIFSEEDRMKWTNKLGNLVLLSGRKNSKAQNFEFDRKKQVYFFAENKTTDFNTTKEIEKYQDWNSQNLRERHQQLKECILRIYSD